MTTPHTPHTLAITGWGQLSSVAIGAEEFCTALASGVSRPSDPRGLFTEPLPDVRAHLVTGFRVRDHLGRKGTGSLDRSTALALVACRQALHDAAVVVVDGSGQAATGVDRTRIGVVLGTTAGSVRSTSEYSRESLISEKPYQVNPMLFPNAVMNCAAGQCAIWHGMRGVNTTVAGGQLAGLGALRYARQAIHRGYADVLLVGAVEEYSPQMAWAAHHLDGAAAASTPPGEGAAFFVVQDAVAARHGGRRVDAEVLAVELGTAAPGDPLEDVLAACLRRALQRAGVPPAEIWAAVTGDAGPDGEPNGGPTGRPNGGPDGEPDGGPDGGPGTGAQERAVAAVLPGNPRVFRIKDLVGECRAASGALQIAAVLGHHRCDPLLDGRAAVVTSCSADGAVAAAVLRGWSRARTDHRNGDADLPG